MTEPTDTEALLAEARTWPRDGINEGALINALADALTTARAERDEQERQTIHLSGKAAQAQIDRDQAQAELDSERIGHAVTKGLLEDAELARNSARLARDIAIEKAERTTDATGRRIREVEAEMKYLRESRDLIYESRQQERHKVSDLKFSTLLAQADLVVPETMTAREVIEEDGNGWE